MVGGLWGAVLGVATATLTPVLAGLGTTLTGPLRTAIDGIAQLNVNVKTTGADGAFTQTALRVGLLNAGSLTTVDLASATAGPNAGRAAVPIVNPLGRDRGRCRSARRRGVRPHGGPSSSGPRGRSLMYTGSGSGIVGPAVLTGGAVVAGSQTTFGPFLLLAVGIAIVAFIGIRTLYRRRQQRSGPLG